MTIEDQIKDKKLQYDINRETSKISALSSGKIDKYEYLTGKEILPSNQQQIIEQVKFSCSPLGKAFEKQTKTIKNQGTNQITAIKESGKQIIEPNEVAKNNFNIDKSGIPLEKQKEIFKLVEERALEFFNVKDKVDPNNLVYVFKTEGNEPKHFRNYQTPLKLFEDLRVGNVSQKEVLKNQAKFKSDLSEIKIGGKKSSNQKDTIKDATNFFDLREIIIDFLEIILFYCLKLKAKQNMEQDLKYYHLTKCLKDYQ